MSETSFSRPTLGTLVARTRNDVLSRMDTDDVLRHSDARVLARAQAGAVHGVYAYLQYIANQLLPDTATDWLERHGSLWGISRNAATKASGTVVLTTVVGAVIGDGALLYSSADIQYQTVGEVSAVGASTTVAVEAVEAGEAGNLDAGSPLSLVSPPTGVEKKGTSGEISGGTDQESLENYRARILSRIRATPMGGSASDYVAWAKEVSGVTRAWCYPEELGAGTVTVRFMRDGDDDPIPSAGEVVTVKAHIDSVRPVTARVTVAAPIADPLIFQISGLSPATAAVKAAVISALQDLITAEAAPADTLLLSHIRESISATAGEYDHVLVFPIADVTPATGHIVTFGGVIWL